jgi:hypothetical protein
LFRQPGVVVHEVRKSSIVSGCSSDCPRTTHGAVTALEHAGDMADIQPRAAVCVVRVERQDAGLLITLMVNADIDQCSRQQVLHLADIDAALDAVRHFLAQFADSSLRSEPSKPAGT